MKTLLYKVILALLLLPVYFITGVFVQIGILTVLAIVIGAVLINPKLTKLFNIF